LLIGIGRLYSLVPQAALISAGKWRAGLIRIGRVAASLLALNFPFLDSTSPAAASLTGACGRVPGIACRIVWDLTHDGRAADVTVVYLAGPIRLVLRVGLVLILALLLRIAAGRLIDKVTARAAGAQERSERGRRVVFRERGRKVFRERRSQRATAIASLLGNAATVTIFAIAGLIIVGDLGLNLAPVLASAGVLGIALGFGAQYLVQDFLSGIFILLEDQYGVGDVIDISTVSGTVEAVSLRVTRLRDVNGVVWIVRNGTITQAGNETHGWARAVVDVPLPYGVSMATARTVLARTAETMAREPRWRKQILDKPEVWGVEPVTQNTILIRVVARTAPLAKPAVTRELTERLMEALGDEQESAAATLATSIPRQPRPADAAPADEPARLAVPETARDAGPPADEAGEGPGPA
jgi:moderate conductance mechanosensitive channel